MGYGKHPKKGKISPNEAAGLIKSGQRIAVSPVCAEPQALMNALVADKDRLNDVEIYTMLPMGECPYARPGMEEAFKVKTFSVGPRLIEAVEQGRAEYIPCHLSQIPGFFADGIIPVDVALIQISPPDENGFCSLGVSTSYTRSLLNAATTVIAEINDQMPRTLGDSYVNLSEVDYVTESSCSLPEIPPAETGEVEKRIAEYTAELIDDGSVIQTGIGNISDAILGALKGKKDLSVHTGTFSDGVLSLIEAGVFDVKKGGSGAGRLITAELIGTSGLYQFCHNNPLVEMRPIEYTHNIQVAGRVKGLFSITSAIQMDLNGQVNAEMLGQKLISGVGGQLDFLRSTASSIGGKGVVAFPSTARKGKVSRIVPKLNGGGIVTVGRADMDFVVTEYGVARLKGKSVSERARELIGIAHPDFRGQLNRDFNKKNN